VKAFCFQIFHYLRRFFCSFRRAVPPEELIQKRNEATSIKISSQQQLIPWFETLGFLVNQNIKLGEGGFGEVYRVTDSVFQKPLIYKQEKGLNWAVEMCGEGQIHREGNLVAAAGELPNMVKIVALVLKVKKYLATKEEFLYLPYNKVKQFQEGLQDRLENSIKNFAVVSQLMEQASGEEVEKTITSAAWQRNTLQQRLAYFDAIVPEILKYYQVALDSNFVHRDIKGPNFFFNLSQKKLTILDPGISAQLDRLQTMSERMTAFFSRKKGPSNTTSKMQMGTRLYLAPAVLRGVAYGAEVDAYAFGKVLLEIIDKTTCQQMYENQCAKIKFDSNGQPTNLDVIFISKAKDCLKHVSLSPENFLNIFLTSEDPLMKLRRKLITAFLALGFSRPENVITNARDWKWSNLQSAYQAYRTAYEKALSPTSKTESSSGTSKTPRYLPSWPLGSSKSAMPTR